MKKNYIDKKILIKKIKKKTQRRNKRRKMKGS
jgi:hypothetical protein